MSEGVTIRARRLDDGTLVQILDDGTIRSLESTTDWARLDAMTEEEIEANALSDPDNPPISDEELARFYRMPNPKAIRQRLQLSQEQFAADFHVPLGTLRDWEQGRSVPDTTARTLLRVIDRNPEAVLQALKSSR